MTDKTVLFPMTLAVSLYMIDKQGRYAIATIDYGGGDIPTPETITAKLEEVALQLAPDGFTICTREEFMIERMREVTGTSTRFSVPSLADNEVWWSELKDCGCGKGH